MLSASDRLERRVVTSSSCALTSLSTNGLFHLGQGPALQLLFDARFLLHTLRVARFSLGLSPQRVPSMTTSTLTSTQVSASPPISTRCDIGIKT